MIYPNIDFHLFTPDSPRTVNQDANFNNNLMQLCQNFDYINYNESDSKFFLKIIYKIKVHVMNLLVIL